MSSPLEYYFLYTDAYITSPFFILYNLIDGPYLWFSFSLKPNFPVLGKSEDWHEPLDKKDESAMNLLSITFSALQKK